MRQPLKPHPMSHSAVVEAIETQVSRSGERLVVRYRVRGHIAGVVLPPPAASERTEELWRHTCFEAFASDAAGGYAEFNFAPSRQWAAYRFDGYRQGMRPLDIAAPEIAVSVTGDELELTASFAAGEVVRLGLSAVIEEADGRVSHWALAHPPGDPDFHHADCFALDLAASGRA